MTYIRGTLRSIAIHAPMARLTSSHIPNQNSSSQPVPMETHQGTLLDLSRVSHHRRTFPQSGLWQARAIGRADPSSTDRRLLAECTCAHQFWIYDEKKETPLSNGVGLQNIRVSKNLHPLGFISPDVMASIGRGRGENTSQVIKDYPFCPFL